MGVQYVSGTRNLAVSKARLLHMELLCRSSGKPSPVRSCLSRRRAKETKLYAETTSGAEENTEAEAGAYMACFRSDKEHLGLK